jgi:hypothetical protein
MLRLHATVAHRYVTSVNPAANERGTPVLLRDATRVEGDLRAQACYDAKRQRDPAREPAGEPVPMTQTCTVVIKLSGLWHLTFPHVSPCTRMTPGHTSVSSSGFHCDQLQRNVRP